MDAKFSDITVIILAGGQATRLQGSDKGLILLSGKPLIEHTLEQIRPYFDSILISANRNIARYRQTGVTVVSDSLADYPGPLAGMLSGLQQCPTRLLATIPCDAPCIGKPYFVTMLDHYNLQQSRACVAYSGTQMQPVYTLLEKHLQAKLATALANGTRKTRDWINSLDPLRVDFKTDDKTFININTPEELQYNEQRLAEIKNGP